MKITISQFALVLKHASRISQLEALLNDYLNGFNIKSYAFTFYRGHVKTGQKLIYDCVSKALKPWHLHYLEQGYADVDRTLHDYYTNSLPYFWDTELQLEQAKHNREQRLRKESIDFGIHKGLSIPVHGPQHDFASLTLHQKKSETCLQNYEELQFEWMSAAQIFYHHTKRILQQTKKSNPYSKLTKRESQCLSYTAMAWRVEQIAKALKISERTVNYHIQNANKKLGVHNKYQAAYQFIEFENQG